MILPYCLAWLVFGFVVARLLNMIAPLPGWVTSMVWLFWPIVLLGMIVIFLVRIMHWVGTFAGGEE